jgi:dTDP-4-dehydrorhamnose reductase
MFDDVFFTPILADTLALVTHELAEKNASGTFNIVGEERLSKFDFANCVAERFGFSKALIMRGQISRSALSAARPHDMSLDNTKVRGLLGRNLGSLNDFLGELYRQERQGRTAELRNAVMEK